ncbi:gliding motility protein GldB-related protein [Raineya orbicola]|jgi:hypothetical protein|uniref:Gliding motility-associated lipoprotein GldB n=1 Tax=Raineya orbicola TaxID=2016530 RepID=A0A2N3IKS4_9BACT|nr:hypothetical protein [Raineya orbicola]PKQ70939.1 hypothetical protein Rain11_0080 [Raineya orbicola]
MRKIFLLLSCLILFACQEKKENNNQDILQTSCLPDVDISKIQLQTTFERIDKAILEAQNETEIQQILEKNPLYNKLYLVREGWEKRENPQKNKEKDFMVEILASMAKEPHLDSLRMDYEKIIPLEKLQNQILDLFKRIKAHYPNFKEPEKVYFSVSGIGSFPLNTVTDIYYSPNGEILVIGLDWFLGPTYKYPLPTHIPTYIARRYVWQNIPTFVAELIGNRYNAFNPNDKTVLNEMLAYAKTYYFAQSVIPCLADSLVLGYTTEQMQYIAQNKEQIWKHYLDKQVFFNTTREFRRDYVEDSPFTLPISQECPGGIARWSALRMLKKYAEKNKLSLPQVMQLQDAKEILQNSGYKGE